MGLRASAGTAYQEIDTLVGAGLPNLVMDIVITRVGAANLAVGMSNFGSVDAGQFRKFTDLAVAKARAALATK